MQSNLKYTPSPFVIFVVILFAAIYAVSFGPGGIVVLALVWVGVRYLRHHPTLGSPQYPQRPQQYSTTHDLRREDDEDYDF